MGRGGAENLGEFLALVLYQKVPRTKDRRPVILKRAQKIHQMIINENLIANFKFVKIQNVCFILI